MTLGSATNSCVVLDHVETDTLERLVFAGDRLKAIDDLFQKSSQDWFFQRLVTLQTQFGTSGAKSAKTLAACLDACYGDEMKSWEKTAMGKDQVKAEESKRNISNIKVMLLRQALVDFYQSTGAMRRQTIVRVKNLLDPKLDHAQPARGGKRPRTYPSSIANSKTQVLLKKTFDSMLIKKDSKFTKVFTAAAACSFLANQSMQDPVMVAEFLDLLAQEAPECPFLLTYIKKDLEKNGTKFGEREIHKRLTQKQLDLLSNKSEALKQSEQFHQIYMGKLRENGEHNLKNNLEKRAQYLEALVKYLGDYVGLEAYAPHLVALVLYNYLTTQERLATEGQTINKAVFLRYLQIPKQTIYAAEPKRKAKVADHRYRVDAIPCLTPIGDDEPFVRRALQQLILLGKFSASKQMNSDYLAALKYETLLMSGKTSLKLTEGYNRALGSTIAYEELQQRVVIELMPSNKEVYLPADPVIVKLRCKNVPSMLIKVYELDAKNYYTQYKKEITPDIGVDGMAPFIQVTKTYTEARIIRKSRAIEIPQLTGRRGVFLVDMSGNGQQARCLIRKGELRFISRQGINANNECVYNFTLFDEACKVVDKGSIWVDGKEYKTDKRTRVAEVPFSGVDRMGDPIVLSDLTRPGSATLHLFDRKTENFRMSCGLFVDRESLLDKANSQALIRPKLFLNDEPVTPKLILNAQLTFKFTTVNGETMVKTVILDGPGMEDGMTNLQECTVPFVVPMQLRTLELTLDAEVAKPSSNSIQKLQNKETFSVNEIDTTPYIADLYLIPRGAEGYAIVVFGKNGEPLSDVVVKVDLKHRYFRNKLNYTLQSDEQGLIQLGRLPDVDSVEAWTSDSRVFHDDKGDRRSSWTLLVDKVNTPNVQNVAARKAIRIPFMEMTTKGSQVYVYDKYFAKEVAKGSSKQGYINIKALPPGDYVVLIRDPYTRATVNVHVSEGTSLKMGELEYVVSPNRVVELSEKKSLQITDIKGSINSGQYRVTVSGAGPDTRLHAISVSMVPRFNSYNFISSPMLNPVVADFRSVPALYTEQSAVSEEYAYIMGRKLAQKVIGSTLQSPSLLAKPWSVQGPAKCVAPQRRQQQVSEATGAKIVRRFPRTVEDKCGGQHCSQDSSNVEFLLNPSTLLYNLKPNASGEVDIPIQGDMGYNLIQIIAVDDNNTSIRNVILPNGEGTQRKEVRLAASLDDQKNYSQKRTTRLMQTKDKYEVGDQRLFEYETYDDISDVFQLFQVTAREQPSSGVITSSDIEARGKLRETLEEFDFINNWDKMEVEEKLKWYDQYACNELNFFIFQKDADFFAQVVRPFLQGKLQKRFFDLFLLGEDLTAFTTTQAFQSLNCFEKILLAAKVPEVQQMVLKQIRDIAETKQPNAPQKELNYDKVWMAKRLSDDSMNNFMDEAAANSRGRWSKPTESGAANGAHYKKNVRPRLAPYIPNDRTSENQETQYFRVPAKSATSDLIFPNLFWLDYAKFTLGKGAGRDFLSENLILAADNLSCMLLAIGALGLPFRSQRGSLELIKKGANDCSCTLAAGGPAIVLCKEIQESEKADNEPFAVDTNYFDPEKPPAESFIQDSQFVSGKVYGSRVVITNVSQTASQVFVLRQIPAGSVPVNNGFRTSTIQCEIAAFKTIVKEYYFYFPFAGEFTHFPAQVFRFGLVSGAGNPGPLLMVEDRQAYEIRTESLQWYSVQKSGKEILAFLKTTPDIYTIDLEQVAWRAQDEKFFIDVTTVLRNRSKYSEDIWAYALKHFAAKEVTEYLQLSEVFAGVMKPHFTLSQLCSYNSFLTGEYQIKEFWPIRSARCHGAKLTTPAFQAQYRMYLLRALFNSYSRDSLTVTDKLTATYYMLLQDRITEAITLFSEINPKEAKSVSEFNYDYMKAYLAFYTGDIKEIQTASSLAAQYLARPLPPSKRELWDQVRKQLNEILDQNQSSDFDILPAQLDAALDISLAAEERQLTIKVCQLRSITINFYKIDLELKFSTNPFTQDDKSYNFVTPNESLTKDVTTLSKEGDAEVLLPVPRSLQDCNCIIEAIGINIVPGPNIVKALTFFGNSLDIQVAKNIGQLRILNNKTNKPVAKAYVKVYGRKRGSGAGIFYKDGYSDLRGRFDYKTLSTDLITDCDKLALLIASESSGSTVVEVKVDESSS